MKDIKESILNICSIHRPCIGFMLTSLFFFSHFQNPIFSQSVNPKPIHTQFTVDEGLPTNEVYHVLQDSIGFIWFATSSGVSRFDGVSFENYGIEEGLVESTIEEIYEDYQGILWFISNTGRLTYFENDVIRPFPFNHRIDNYLSESRGPVKKSFYVDKYNNVHLSLKDVGRLVISPEGVVKKIGDSQSPYDIKVHILPNGIALPSVNLTSHREIIFIEGNDSIVLNTRNDLNFFKTPFHSFTLRKDKGSLVGTIGGNIFNTENGNLKQVKNLSYDIVWANLEDSQNLWVALVEGGVYLYEKADFTKKEKLKLFDNILITSVCNDKEGGYWFTSLTHGVFYCPNINVLNYCENTGLPSSRATSVFANERGLYIGYDYGTISEIRNGEIKNYIIGGDNWKSTAIRFIEASQKSPELWIGTRNHLYSLKDGYVLNPLPEETYYATFPRQIIVSNDGEYWIASSWGIRKFDGEKLTYNSRDNNQFTGSVYSVYEDSLGVLWMGTSNGVWNYKDGFFHYLGNEKVFFSSPVNHIVGTSNGDILFGSKGLGLIIYDGNSFNRISQADGIISNYINKIIEHESGIWLATNNGISWIKGNYNNDYEIHNITTYQGLPTSNVTNLFIKKNRVYIATTKGITSFDIQNLALNTIKPIVKLKNVRVANREMDISTKSILLNYDQNHISIDYIGLAYKNMGNVTYRYRLMGLDSTWVHTKSTNARYYGLNYGNYTFEIQAQNSDGIWGDSNALRITISPPFWQTYWFILLSAIIFSSIIYMVYQVRIRAIRKRNQLLNSINIYKQQSLRQQMNPHFIFNTLNSIQLYILEKDHISSHKYLTKFAKLMRLILDNSQEQTVLLKDEIDALTLYLELESIRLSGKFEYDIEIEDNKLLSYRIPTLLIQPFVENAIWHGLMLKPKQEGWVKVHISENNNSIICSIEDNGVGRAAAQTIRKKQDAERKSLGFKITTQRIEILNSLFKDKFEISYTDLTDDDGKPNGTRVDINIPYSYKNNSLNS